MAKGSSAVVISCDKFDFYRKFLEFIRPVKPVSELRNKQLDVLAALLWKRGEISNQVTNSSLIPQLLFSTDVRDSILKTCSIS